MMTAFMQLNSHPSPRLPLFIVHTLDFRLNSLLSFDLLIPLTFYVLMKRPTKHRLTSEIDLITQVCATATTDSNISSSCVLALRTFTWSITENKLHGFSSSYMRCLSFQKQKTFLQAHLDPNTERNLYLYK